MYTTEKEEQALIYAVKYGYPVIPVSPSKVPYIERWNSGNAATTYEQAYNYWAKYPEADIGILTGTESQLIVVDVDNRDSVPAVIRLVEDNSSLTSETLVMADTARGAHLYFSYDYNQSISKQINFLKNSAFGIEHVDLIAQNSFVIAPPSSNKTWANGNSIHDNIVPAFPSVLLDTSLLATTNSMCNSSVCNYATEAPLGACVTTAKERDREMLAELMRHPIPLGRSYEYMITFGIKIYSLFDNPQKRFRNWFGLRDHTITQAKVQERLRQLEGYIKLTEEKLKTGKIRPTRYEFAPAQGKKPSRALIAELRRLLRRCTKSPVGFERIVELAAYLLSCAKAVQGREFYRSYRDIMADCPELLAEVAESSRPTTLSRLLGRVVGDYLDKGGAPKCVPIFHCVAHGESFQAGRRRNAKAGRYRLNDGCAYLLEL